MQEFDETHDDVTETLESLRQLREAGALDLAGAPDVSADQAPAAAVSLSSDSESPWRASEANVELPEDREMPPAAAEKLPALMEWLALRSDLDSLAGQSSAVTMMTVHSAKGLEFPVVFVAGLEEGIFPHRAHEGDPESIEEERRLAYVAITRAERRLYLTYAATRRTFGSVSTNPRSRFLNEIPAEDVHATGVGSSGFSGVGWEKRGDRHGTYGSGRGSEVYGGHVFGSRTRSTGGSPAARPTGPVPIQRDRAKAAESFAPGDRVSHKTFGPGVVKSASGDNRLLPTFFRETDHRFM